MRSPIDSSMAKVKVRRYGDSVTCEVIVLFRGQEMVLNCRDYSQAVKWARIECKTYGSSSIFVERVGGSVGGQT